VDRSNFEKKKRKLSVGGGEKPRGSGKLAESFIFGAKTGVRDTDGARLQDGEKNWESFYRGGRLSSLLDRTTNGQRRGLWLRGQRDVGFKRTAGNKRPAEAKKIKPGEPVNAEKGE